MECASFLSRELPQIIDGAGGRTRTDMGLLPPDFESGAYTNFATPAARGKIISRVITESQLVKAVRVFANFNVSACSYG